MAIHNRKNTNPEKKYLYLFTFYWVRREYDVSRNWQTSWVMLCSVCVVGQASLSFTGATIGPSLGMFLLGAFVPFANSLVSDNRSLHWALLLYDSDLHYLCLEVMNFLSLNIKWNLLCGSVCNIQECHIVCKHQYVLAYWNPLALEVGLLNPARGPGGTL